MLCAYNAFTRESINSLRAARDIQAQVDALPLKANSIGVMVCEQSFIDNGIASAIAGVLPFPIIGVNTTLSGVQGAHDVHLLSLLILTADELTFETYLSEPFGDLAREKPLNPFRNINLGEGEPPALILAFCPMLFEVGVDEGEFFDLLREVTGEALIFGSLAVNYANGYYAGTRVIHNNRQYLDRSALVAIRGPLTPRFVHRTIPRVGIIEGKAVITKVRNTILLEINHQPPLKFLEEHGLYSGDRLTGAHTYPFIISPRQGKPPFNTICYGITPEGYLQCGKTLPEGGVISVIAQDLESVLKTTREVIQEVNADPNARAVLFFSCHGRSLVLGFEDMAELDLVKDSFPGFPPYLFAYSGGEIAPVPLGSGGMTSRLLTHTLIACIL